MPHLYKRSKRCVVQEVVERVTSTYRQRESCYTTICGFPLIIFSLAGIQEARKRIRKGLGHPKPLHIFRRIIKALYKALSIIKEEGEFSKDT